MQIPANPKPIPVHAKAVGLNLYFKDVRMISQIGNDAPMMAPRPALMYLRAHVDVPLLITKLKNPRSAMGSHCFPRGHFLPL